MGTFATFLLVWIAATGAAGQVSAASLSDLGAFTQSSRQVEQLFTDPKRAKTYREAIQSYAAPRGDFSREFDATLEQLRKLRSQVGGVNDRLLKTRKPMAFQYAAPSKPTYRFERIAQPLHAIWLLRQLHEANTDACSARDTLLVDRWTPILDGASVFSVERDGRYIGITLTLVPVRAVKASYLLVVPNDSASRLPAPLLEAFLRDYRKREPKTLPFALLTNPEVSVFQIEKVDADGRRAGRLGPIEGFRLADPMAQKIAASVPGWCNKSANLAMGGGIAGAGFAGGAKSPTSAPLLNPLSPSGSPVNVSAEAKVTVQAPGGASGGGAKSNYSQSSSIKSPSGAKGGGPVSNQVDNSQRSYRAGDTTIISGVSSPELADRGAISAAVPTPSGATGVPSLTAGSGGVSPAPPSRGPASVGGGSSGGGGGARGVGGGVNSGGVTGPMGSLEGIDRAKLSPSDRNLYDAIRDSQGALINDKTANPRGIGEVVRGALDKGADPKLKKAAEEVLPQLYFNKKNSLQAYEELEKRQKERPEEVRRMMDTLEKNFCNYCTDCEFCRELRKGKAAK